MKWCQGLRRYHMNDIIKSMISSLIISMQKDGDNGQINNK
jgi:hypothetical protein